jgi:Phage protein (N4 Gp49/phage Sf6 gene 66) family
MNNNRVTPEQIDALLDKAETAETVFWGKQMVVSYRFPDRNGFVLLGSSSCVDPANFDLEIGRKIAREDVKKQLWQLEGYRLQLSQ